MNSHSVALIITVFAFAPSALSESTCTAERDAEGECLLQSQSQMGLDRKLIKEEEEDYEPDPADDSEDEGQGVEDDDENDDDESSFEPPQETEDEHSEETAALQSNVTVLGGTCTNMFGDNRGRGIQWQQMNQGKVASQVSGEEGAMYTNRYFPINLCDWWTTVGASLSVTQTLLYNCKGMTNGKKGFCKSKRDSVDCYNGLCAVPSNVKGDWSEAPLVGTTCHKTNTYRTTGNKGNGGIGNYHFLKNSKGKPDLKLWDPNCKIMCENMAGCTGFTLHKAKKAARCFFLKVSKAFAEQSSSSGGQGRGNCYKHKAWDTYFLKSR